MTPADRLIAALRSLHGSGMPKGIDCVHEWRPPAGPVTPEKENAIKYLQRLRQALELQQADIAIKRLEQLRRESARAKLNWATRRAFLNAEGSITVESQVIETTASPQHEATAVAQADPAERDAIDSPS